MKNDETIGSYLIQQLGKHGVKHVFGVPGDYVLTFMKQIEQSALQMINTCDEQGAGFAADAYARIHGLGVVCITYGVGGLKIANTTAQAFSEQSPVIVISGAPGLKERSRNALLHHKVRNFDTQFKIFEQITVAATVLDQPQTAFYEIDRVLEAALRFKQPVYIEIPRDMVLVKGIKSQLSLPASPKSDRVILSEALNEALPKINAAKQPVFIIGNEVHRFGLQKAVEKLIEKSQIPFVSLLQSKSVLPETNPLFIGVYEGGIGREEVRSYVEKSDCLILLGAELNDMNMGIFTARLEPRLSIFAARERTSIAHHHFSDILLEDFIDGLKKSPLKKRSKPRLPKREFDLTFEPQLHQKVTVKRLFECLNVIIEDHHIVIADPGDSLFAGSDLFIHEQTEFMSCAYYASLGFAVPASIGVQCANPKLRPLVLVGDGAFQMTGMELATSVRFKLNPIVVVLNNRGYGTERPMTDGTFNDVLNWNFSKIPEVLGKGTGFDVYTEQELLEALGAAGKLKEFCILDVHLEQDDFSPALKRLTTELGKRVKASSN